MSPKHQLLSIKPPLLKTNSGRTGTNSVWMNNRCFTATLGWWTEQGREGPYHRASSRVLSPAAADAGPALKQPLAQITLRIKPRCFLYQMLILLGGLRRLLLTHPIGCTAKRQHGIIRLWECSEAARVIRIRRDIL